MKAILLVLVFAFAVSFSGNASNVVSLVTNRTESAVVSKANSASSSQMSKTKKPHAKKHHKATASKKAPVAK